jgi:hypothetical protein
MKRRVEGCFLVSVEIHNYTAIPAIRMPKRKKIKLNRRGIDGNIYEWKGREKNKTETWKHKSNDTQ